MDVNSNNVKEYLSAVIIAADNDATAASTGDATEVTPADDIDVEPYESGLVVIHYKTTLTAEGQLV